MFKTTNTLKLISCLIPAFCSLSYAAENPQCPSSTLKAEYIIEHSTNGSEKNDTKMLTLWRNHEEVAHEYHHEGIVDKWYLLPNKAIKLTRYFENQQQAIEYEPIDTHTNTKNNDWSAYYKLIPEEQMASLSKINSQGKGCELTEVYQSKDDKKSITVHWKPSQQIISLFEKKDATSTETWKLEKVVYDKTSITQVFSKWDNYQSTDYADIGDNENNPFLSKMINQGFVAGHSINQHSH